MGWQRLIGGRGASQPVSRAQRRYAPLVGSVGPLEAAETDNVQQKEGD